MDIYTVCVIPATKHCDFELLSSFRNEEAARSEATVLAKREARNEEFPTEENIQMANQGLQSRMMMLEELIERRNNSSKETKMDINYEISCLNHELDDIRLEIEEIKEHIKNEGVTTNIMEMDIPDIPNLIYAIKAYYSETIYAVYLTKLM